MSSFGEELKRERELRQISLREVSEATKINLRYLEALERNDFRHLPGGVFNKGFVRAYSEYVGIDPEAMVNAYLLEERGQEDVHDGSSLPAPRSAEVTAGAAETQAEHPKRGWGRRNRTAVFLILLLLAMLALVGLLVISLSSSFTSRRLAWERASGTATAAERLSVANGGRA